MNPFGPYAGVNAGYSPLAGPAGFSPWAPYQGAPGGMLGQMGLQMMLDPMMSAMGLAPLGLNSGQNAFDRMRHMQMTQMMRQSMQHAGQADQAKMMRFLQTAATATGAGWTPEQQQRAQQLTGFVSSHMDVFASIAPDLIDRASGSKGSAAVMAMRMFNAGQLRMDPVTGRPGMSGESMGRIANDLYKDLYESPNSPNMMGISAGQVGSMVDEMTRRGMMPGFGGTRGAMLQMSKTHGATLNNALSRAGLAGRDVSSLSDAELGSVAQQDDVKALLGDGGFMRGADKNQIKGSLDKMKGAVAAMKDIFGAAGHKGSMEEIFNALEAITRGTTAQLDPGKLESIVRTFGNLATRSQVGLPGAMMMLQHAGAQGQMMGLHDSFAMGAAAHGMAFRTAFVNSDFAGSGIWNLSNVDKLAQADISLTQGAANSPIANQMAVAMRASAVLGQNGLTGNAARLVGSIRAGKPAGDLMGMNEEEFVQMMVDGSGGTLTTSTVRSMLDARRVNQQYIQENNMGGMVRDAQGRIDVEPFLAETAGDAIGTTLGDLGVRDKGLIGDMGKAAAQSMRGMDAQSLASPRIRAARIAQAMRKAGGAKLERALAGKSKEEQEKILLGMAENVWGYSDTEFAGEFGLGMADVLATTNENMMGKTKDEIADATAKGMMQSAMAGLGSSDLLQRVSDAMQDSETAKDPDVLVKSIAKALGGGVEKEAIAKKFVEGVRSIKELGEQGTAQWSDYEKSIATAELRGDSKEADRLRNEYKAHKTERDKKIEDQTKALLETAEDHMLDPLAKEGKDAGLKPAAKADAGKQEDIKLSGTLRITNPDGSISQGEIVATGQRSHEGQGVAV